MVAHLIAQFRSMQADMLERIEDYESAEFQHLDHEMSDVFEKIYEFEPRSPSDVRMLFDFLLSLVADNDGGDNHRLIQRMQALLQQAPQCESSGGPPDISGGDGI